MKAEDIAEKHLKKIIPESYNRTTGRIAIMIDAMEEYHQSQLQALKESVLDLGFMEVEVMRQKQYEDGSFSGHRENTIVVEREEVMQLITNPEDK